MQLPLLGPCLMRRVSRRRAERPEPRLPLESNPHPAFSSGSDGLRVPPVGLEPTTPGLRNRCCYQTELQGRD